MLKASSLEKSQTLADWFEAIPAGLIVINGEGVINQFNQAASDIFNHMKTNDKWCDVITHNIKEINSNGYYIQCHSGKHILFKTQSLPNKKGQLVLLLDETALKNNNEAQMKLQKLQSIEKLSATLAHQLRTPLSTAILYASNLNAKKATLEEINDYQTKILEQLTVIKDQIDDVLLTSRNEVGFINQIDLKHEILSLIKIQKALHPEIEFKLHTQVQIKYHILGNGGALRGAFSNIIENAIDASKNKKTIEIKLNHQKSVISIEVTDYGVGISNEHIQRVLEPFFTTKNSGTGIGLTIAKSIIEAHQGTIAIESKEKEFTKIRVVFPTLGEEK